MNNNLKRGDIVWLKENVKSDLGENINNSNRPYIIISNDKNNSSEKSHIVNIACLTKQEKKFYYPMHVFLDKNKYNLQYNSLICCEQILTINKEYINRKISSLDEKDLKLLNKALYIQLINEDLKLFV